MLPTHYRIELAFKTIFGAPGRLSYCGIAATRGRLRIGTRFRRHKASKTQTVGAEKAAGRMTVAGKVGNNPSPSSLNVIKTNGYYAIAKERCRIAYEEKEVLDMEPRYFVPLIERDKLGCRKFTEIHS
jgi:hypothetical protein